MLVKGNQSIILDTATKCMFSCFLLLFFLPPLNLLENVKGEETRMVEKVIGKMRSLQLMDLTQAFLQCGEQCDSKV